MHAHRCCVYGSRASACSTPAWLLNRAQLRGCTHELRMVWSHHSWVLFGGCCLVAALMCCAWFGRALAHFLQHPHTAPTQHVKHSLIASVQSRRWCVSMSCTGMTWPPCNTMYTNALACQTFRPGVPYKPPAFEMLTCMQA
eukprot:scaffold134215_cov27-Tisochrysis_lutea.AAC.3